MRSIRWLENLRVRDKLLFSYLATFCVIIALGSMVIYSIVRNTIETNIESELKNSTDAMANMVRTAVSVSIKNHLRAVAEKNLEMVTHLYALYQAGEFSEDRAKKLATSLLLSQRIGTTGYIACVSSKGIMRVHPEAEWIGQDINRYDFVKEMREKKQGYIEYRWKNPGEAEARPKAMYMAYFKPWDWIIAVSSYRKEFRTLVNIDDFRNSVLALHFSKSGYAFVTDSKGNVIIHPRLQGMNVLADPSFSNYPLETMLKEKSGQIIYPWRNPGETHTRDKLVRFQYLPEYEWIVASSSYLDEFYAPLDKVRNVIIFTVLGCILLVLPITALISGSITNPLAELVKRLEQGARGDLSVRLERHSDDEVGRLARYFNLFMERLEDYSSNLEAEIKERKDMEKQVLDIGDRERQKIGQDLHDDLCPHLIGVEGLGKVLARRLSQKAPAEGQLAGKITELIKDAITKTRRLARGLCPVYLVDHGLASSLRELAANTESVFGVSCRFECNATVSLRDNLVATHLFHIVQEAVHNAVRHGKATHVTIVLDVNRDGLAIGIHDDGQGFPTEMKTEGMGLRIMGFRANMIRAALDIRAGETGGTTVQVSLKGAGVNR
jgi:signal transduction histidine kinase